MNYFELNYIHTHCSNKPTYRVPVGNLDQTRCKIDNTLDEKFNSISVDVTCFDEYIAKAIACEVF